ncbi:hypothetical protein P4123_26350 [Pseudomonas aeruginosa]|nr:hypothetical protein [Pseudomonas aeruginosa]
MTNCTGVARRNCAHGGSIQCRPAHSTSIGSTSGNASNSAAITHQRSRRRRSASSWRGCPASSRRAL